jgi:8-oxo-dGTP diphosphatase
VDVAVAVLVRAVAGRGPEILLTRRPPGTHLAGCWELPGGKLGGGETPEAALRRELREEIGLEIGPLEPLASHEHCYPDRTVRLHAMVARVPAESTVRTLDGIEHRWVPLPELSACDLPPANGPITAALIERLAQPLTQMDLRPPAV